MAPDARRKDFIEHVRLVGALYRAVLPDPVASSYSGVVTLIESIADDIRLRTGDGPADITSVMGKISRLLDTSVAAEGYKIEPAAEEGDDLDARPGIVDLSQIDFEALRKRFGISRHKNIELEELKRAIRARLDKLILLNKSRVDYLKKFEELIESYNQGSRTVDELLDDLITLSQALTKEQDRHVREHLTEEELAIFDVLTRPGPALSPEEREEVKKVAKELLGRLRALLVIDWRKRSGSLAQVRIAIEDTLDGGLPRTYTPDLFKQKCGALFEHVFENLGRAS
jgi:type I restriction enzyme R subunit